MGSCNSKPSYLATTSGNERDYQTRYHESTTLGQGMFGTVKLVHDVTNRDLIAAKPLAVKYVKKGYTFRDNILYTPMKKEALITEVEILRALNGECYTLQLVAVYESPSMIYIITEYCEGGEMMPWVSMAFATSSNNANPPNLSSSIQSNNNNNNNNNNNRGLRTEDVSRIAYQLWSAVHHCAQHKVIHRDIKPENVMFCTKDRDSPVRLIDFGSGTMDGANNNDENNSNNNNHSNIRADDNTVERHHTFAGSAFYISPEMFQRTYTDKTDVWSVAVTLYVLVAGYPAERLQEAFDILHSSSTVSTNKTGGGGGGGGGGGNGRIRSLPNMPENIPESFYEMLEGALVYRHKARMDAGQLMQCEFAQFHLHHHEEQQLQLQLQEQQQIKNQTTRKMNAMEEETRGGKRPGGVISITEVANEAANVGDELVDTNNLPTMTNNSKSGSRKTQSVLLEGSVSRHTTYLGYQKFERSVTTILATMLSKETCTKLLLLLRGEQQRQRSRQELDETNRMNGITSGNNDIATPAVAGDGGSSGVGSSTKEVASSGKLQVVTLEVLLKLLGGMQGENATEVEEVVTMIRSMKNFQFYERFAYHVSLLQQFVSLHSQNTNTNTRNGGNDAGIPSSVHGNNVWNSLKKKRGLGSSVHSKDGSGHGKNSDSLSMSIGMGSGMRRIVTATGSLSTMLQDGDKQRKI